MPGRHDCHTAGFYSGEACNQDGCGMEYLDLEPPEFEGVARLFTVELQARYRDFWTGE